MAKGGVSMSRAQEEGTTYIHPQKFSALLQGSPIQRPRSSNDIMCDTQALKKENKITSFC